LSGSAGTLGSGWVTNQSLRVATVGLMPPGTAELGRKPSACLQIWCNPSGPIGL